ncbi:MAG: septum site-determining protein MinD [Clostridiales Family XIII bacterium]|nr:septum site-determining protein MinD [Clostridiales Family XIII bacterium]
MGKIIIAASGKGGVGKSVFTVNLGATFAERGVKVVMIDMNLGLRNLDIYLGLENRVIFDVADVLGGLCGYKRALLRDKRFSCLHMIPATQDRRKFAFDAETVADFYAGLRENYDYVLVDGPAGVGRDMALAAAGGDIAVIITTLEYVALRDADMADRVLSEAGVTQRACVLNKVNRRLMRSGLFPSFEDVSARVRPPLVGIIQYDENIHISANCGVPIVHQKGSYIEENFNRIADRLLGL